MVGIIWIYKFVPCVQAAPASESRKPGSRFERIISTTSLFSVDEAELFNFSDEVSCFILNSFDFRDFYSDDPHN